MSATWRVTGKIHVSLEGDGFLYLMYDTDLYSLEEEGTNHYTFRKCCRGGEVNTVYHRGGRPGTCSCKGYQFGTRKTGIPCRHQKMAEFLLKRW